MLKISSLAAILIAVVAITPAAASHAYITDEPNFEIGVNKNVSPLGNGRYESPSWSPNGQFLAFIFFDGDIELWIYDTETEKLSRLAEELYLRFSGIGWRDNQHLAFLSGESLYSVDIVTNELEVIADNALGWKGFAFNPNDPNMLIISKHQYRPISVYHRSELYLLDLDKQTTDQLTDTPNISEETPIFSPNGQSLAYITVTGKDFDEGQLGDYGITVKFINDPQITVNTSVVEGEHHLAWSPDGDGVAFRASYDGDLYDDAGIYFLDLSESTRIIKLIGHSDVRDGIGQFSWSNTNQFAITTVGSPQGNDLLIVTIPN